MPTPPTTTEEVVEPTQTAAGSETLSEELNPDGTPKVAAPAAKPAAHETPKWVTRRLDTLTRQKYEERARADTLTREVEALKARLGEQEAARQATPRLDAEGKPLPSEAPARRTAPAEDPNVIAARMVEQREFDSRCNAVFEAGQKLDPDFDTKIARIAKAGEVTKDFLEVIVDSPIAPEILVHLADNPDEAAELLDLSPRQQARALGLLEARLQADAPDGDADPDKAPAPRAAPVSKVPDPIRPVKPRGPVNSSPRPSDSDDMTTWMKKRNAELKSRQRA